MIETSHAGLLTLPHYLRPGLRVAFIGYNPAIYSAEAGHYYARPGNVFWRQLSASGIAGRTVTHLDDAALMDEAGIGFLDLVCRPTVRAGELTKDELREGSLRLLGELTAATPRFAVFSGRGIYQEFGRHALGVARRELAGRPNGVQPERIPGPFGESIPFVIPSSSGLASKWHAERLGLLHELRDLLAAADG